MTLRMVDDILELVGETPLVRLNRLAPKGGAPIYAKIEFMNPGGSIKDRAALRMIEAAEASGELKPGKIVLEATSGNTGIGLAMVCAVKGYKMLFTMSESASEERRKILRAYGADILLTPAHMATDGAIEEAYRMARDEPEKYFLVDQFNNPDNPKAHSERGTADEIFDATAGQVRVVVATLGTSGTAMGLAQRLHELSPEIKLIAVEPYQGHKIQGLKNMKESLAPGIFDPRLPDEIVNIDDDEAYATARRLAREEGIFVGMSSGAAVAEAIKQAEKLGDGLVVAIVPDGGERYLSTSLFVSEKVPEPLKFFNTLTRQIDELRPVRPGHVGMYACGPSLDGPPDLGLCRRMVFADLVRRYLELRGFDVKLVVNIADIDDRTVNQCLAEGEKLDRFAAKWEQAFHVDMAKINILPATEYPKASTHVMDMVEETRKLLAKDVAYEKLRSVYFNISRYPEYGKLSSVDLNAIQSGKTVDYDYYEKENPSDFTLFKRASLAELKAGIYWQTPWGNCRPGWHVECSCMSSIHLGQPFDMHLASTDLIFPHGDNEIAIAESLYGKPLANMWLHSDVVMIDGKKANRAMGNDVTLRALLDKGYSAQAVRYWLLGQHYRRALRFNSENLDLAERTVRRLNDFVARMRFLTPQAEAKADVDQKIYEARYGFQEAMDQDLNMPKAMGFVFGFIKDINRIASDGGLTADQIEKTLNFMKRIDKVLAVIDFNGGDIDPAIDELVRRRDEARANGDFAAADAIRDQLGGMGISLDDTPQGTRWYRE